MYSKRSPPTVPAGMELPYMSIPDRWGIAPSTGISLLRRYSSMPGSICGVTIRASLRPSPLVLIFGNSQRTQLNYTDFEGQLGIYGQSNGGGARTADSSRTRSSHVCLSAMVPAFAEPDIHSLSQALADRHRRLSVCSLPVLKQSGESLGSLMSVAQSATAGPGSLRAV